MQKKVLLAKILLTFSAGGLDTGAGVDSFERENKTLIGVPPDIYSTSGLAVKSYSYIYFLYSKEEVVEKDLDKQGQRYEKGIFPMIYRTCTLVLWPSVQAGLRALSGPSGVESMTALTRKQKTHLA